MYEISDAVVMQLLGSAFKSAMVYIDTNYPATYNPTTGLFPITKVFEANHISVPGRIYLTCLYQFFKNALDNPFHQTVLLADVVLILGETISSWENLECWKVDSRPRRCSVTFESFERNPQDKEILQHVRTCWLLTIYPIFENSPLIYLLGMTWHWYSAH